MGISVVHRAAGQCFYFYLCDLAGLLGPLCPWFLSPWPQPGRIEALELDVVFVFPRVLCLACLVDFGLCVLVRVTVRIERAARGSSADGVAAARTNVISGSGRGSTAGRAPSTARSLSAKSPA